jgi:hypothetical protein
MFSRVGNLKKSRKGDWTQESSLDFPNIWLLRNISTAADPKNVAIPLFAQRFRVSGT